MGLGFLFAVAFCFGILRMFLSVLRIGRGPETRIFAYRIGDKRRGWGGWTRIFFLIGARSQKNGIAVATNAQTHSFADADQSGRTRILLVRSGGKAKAVLRIGTGVFVDRRMGGSADRKRA